MAKIIAAAALVVALALAAAAQAPAPEPREQQSPAPAPGRDQSNALQKPRPQTPMPAPPFEEARVIDDLVAANRILADQGVLDAYGHVSVRNPRDPAHFFLARSTAPETVTTADILEHDLDGNAPQAQGKTLFLERFIHAEIYRARPDVMAVVHTHAPSLIPFGVTGMALRPVYHMSAFLGTGVPIFDPRADFGDTDLLIRTPALGKALAHTLGAHTVALQRGHGGVVVAGDLPHVVFRAVYTEMNAKLQAQALDLGKRVVYLDPGEAQKAEASMGGTIARPWELWKKKALSR
jgi:ribulose-5-phosphate 4-epimerase/fuculose-1-phosphate aldolase